MKKLLLVLLSTLFIVSCAPKVGSEAWCDELKEKAKSDWTMEETKDFAKHCIF